MRMIRKWATPWGSPAAVRRGLAYAVVVGTILIAINHGDALLRGDVTVSRVIKMALTVAVPFVVSTLSSAAAARERGDPRP
jgi:hypothetical protein